MTDDPYRDPLAGQRARVGALAARVAEREARVTDALAHALPPDLALALRQSRGALGDRVTHLPALDVDGLVELEQHLEVYDERLGRALRLVPAIERALRQIDDGAPVPAFRPVSRFVQPSPRLWALDEAAAGLRRAFERSVGGVAPEAAFEVHGALTTRARFEVGGTPFVATAQIGTDENAPLTVHVDLVTSAARGAPRLRLRREGPLDGFGKLVRLVRDVALGHERFDGLFVVDAEPTVAVRYLTPEVRQALLEVAALDGPELVVGPSFAGLAFGLDPTPRAFRAAVTALERIRAISVGVDLELGPGEV